MMDISEKNNRSYTNGEITVYWLPKFCIHSGECFTQLPKVFQPQRRPWIDLSAAKTQDIINTVNECPTDALTYKYNNAIEIENNEEKASVKITCKKNGPFIVRGRIELFDYDGNVIQTNENTALCSCGKTRKPPFCDGAHSK